jgi:hypothetical protein
VIVSLLFFVGLMLILRSLLEIVPKWRMARQRKRKKKEESRSKGHER